MRPEIHLPLVTVGVPVYNGERFLEEALRTLAAQTYTNLEILISDNASTDRTQEICEQFAAAHPGATYVRQKTNIGASENFRYLRDRAKGEYFMWYAADDSSSPTLIAELVSFLEAHTDYALVCSDVEVIDDAGQAIKTEQLETVRPAKIDQNWPAVFRGFLDYYVDNRYFLIYGLYRTACVQRGSIDCYGKIRTMASSEMQFLTQLCCMGKVGAIAKPLKIYRSHQDSLYQTEVRQLKPIGWALSHFLEKWICVWTALMRGELSGAMRLRMLGYLGLTFPLNFGRASKREWLEWRARRAVSHSNNDAGLRA